MKKIFQNKRSLIAAGIVSVGAALAVIGCSGSGSGGSSGGSSGGGFGGLTSGFSNMVSQGGQGLGKLTQGAGGSTGNHDLDTLMTLGQKFAEAAELDNPQRQAEIGQSCALVISNSNTMSTNMNRNDYVNMVGMTVASVCPNPELEFNFGIIESPDVNAYSTPGGYVFITRGALELCSDESELAGVLGHEIAHVCLNHGIEQLKAEKWTDLVLSGAEAKSKEFRQFEQATDKGAQVFVSGLHSRPQEDAADSESVKYLAAAGYDPNGLTRFLTKLQAKTGAGGLENIMKSHPGTAERVKRVQQQASAMGSGQTLKDRYGTWVR